MRPRRFTSEHRGEAIAHSNVSERRLDLLFDAVGEDEHCGARFGERSEARTKTA